MARLADMDADYKLLLRYTIPFCGAHFGAFTVYTARSIRVPFFLSRMGMDPWFTEMIFLHIVMDAGICTCRITIAGNHSVMAI